VKKTGAGLARHRSKQDIGTPGIFISAVEARFGELDCDLAANKHNTKCDRFISEEQNSLAFDWSTLQGNLWLNPPFGNIEPWAKKCAERKNDPRWTLLLVPAAVGANWFQQHVVPNAHVIELNDRITFVGSKTGYPKDLVLCVFGFGMTGRSWWHWDARKTKAYNRVPKLKSPRKSRAATAGK
jgi:phage N-6-adenine-methyltransferase